jgi:hypothetical protein
VFKNGEILNVLTVHYNIQYTKGIQRRWRTLGLTSMMNGKECFEAAVIQFQQNKINFNHNNK